MAISPSLPFENTSEAPKETLRRTQPSWVKPALLILLLLTAVAYIWGLNASGYANSFYSAAVQAATKSWKAFFFGSIDASNFITVDKPPFSLWAMDLSARLFGLSSWSILIPEAIEGVLSVYVLYLMIARWFGPRAGLLAGFVLASTPVAALMFRFNNPDAMLVLLLTTAAYTLTLALEQGKTKWIVFTSILIGFAFLTKMLAAFIVLPGFALVYLVFAPIRVRQRIMQLIISGVTIVVSGGWWVAIVSLLPAADRPYIGSSQDNSLLNLIFGYNGIGRLTGSESGFGGGGGGAMFSGATGITRLFAADMGGQISWLLPAALLLMALAFWFSRREQNKKRVWSALSLWGLTLIITGIVFSFGSGIIHTYYTVALAPSVGALVGIGAEILWRKRQQKSALLGVIATILVTILWSYVLLDRSASWLPWLRYTIVLVGVLASLALWLLRKSTTRLSSFMAGIALLACLGGAIAYSIETIATPHTGSTPTAGPTVASSQGGFPGGFSSRNRFFARAGEGFPSGSLPSGMGTTPSSKGFPTTTSQAASTFAHQRIESFRQGGPGGSTNVSQAVVKRLQANGSSYRFVAATISAMSSAPYQLASGYPIMDIGGFTGSDPTPTLAAFKQYVQKGEIHYFIASGQGFGGFGGGLRTRGTSSTTSKESIASVAASLKSTSQSISSHEQRGFQRFQGGPGGRSQVGSSITSYVESHFTKITVDGVTLYDLTKPIA